MNKKFNTVLFMIGSTVFNVILIAAVALILFFAALLIFGGEMLSEADFLYQRVIPAIFVLSLPCSFFIYRIIMRQIEKRKELSKYLEPFFRFRKK